MWFALLAGVACAQPPNVMLLMPDQWRYDWDGFYQPVLDAARILSMQALVREVPVSSDLLRLVASLVRATHPDHPGSPESVKRLVRFGSSPRGGQALVLASKARALVEGRLHVTAEDIAALAAPVLRHRLIPSYEGEAARSDPDDLVRDALAAVQA